MWVGVEEWLVTVVGCAYGVMQKCVEIESRDCKTPKTLSLRLPTINWLLVYNLSFTLIKANVK